MVSHYDDADNRFVTAVDYPRGENEFSRAQLISHFNGSLAHADRRLVRLNVEHYGR